MDEKLYIQDIIDSLAEKQGIKRADAETFVKSIFDIIKDALITDKIVKIKGLGTFKLTEVDSRESVNINTGERIRIESHTKISFIPDMQMRDLINKPFSHFETVVLNEGVNFEDMSVVTDDEEKEDTDEPSGPSQKIQEETSVEKPVIPEEPENETADTQEINNDAGPIKQQEEATIISSAAPNKKTDSKSHSHRHSALFYGLGFAFIGILSVCGIIFFVYNKEVLNKNINEDTFTKHVAVQQKEIKPLQEETASLQKDTLLTAPNKETEKIDTTQTVITGVRKGYNTVIADSTSYIIVGTMSVYKIATGETLTMVSKRFYETKDLWPYIVMHNRDIIKNPNRVPSGIVIRIPALRDKKE